jgi:nucleoside-diphosphate-sugar epimerase
MRVFVTGATGHIGSLVVAELLTAGHEVSGLARSDKSAAALTAADAQVHRGALDDLDSLRAAAAGADGVIHLAYIHDFSNYAAAGATDLRAVQAIGEALVGTNKPFVVTSGRVGVKIGQILTEDDIDEAANSPRSAAENAAIALARQGVRSSVVRLAPSVHGPADPHGFIPILINIAREKGVSAYVDDGTNRWPAVHELDAARLFRLALEAAPAGTRLHGFADEGVPFRDIAEAIGAHFGWLGGLVPLDIPASSTMTQKLLAWRPQHPGLIADLDEGHYFKQNQ